MKKIFLFLLCWSTTILVFSQETKSQLTTRFNVIRNETATGANTKIRVANAYQELSDGTISVYPVSATGTDTYIGSLIGIDSYTDKIVFVTFQNNNTGASSLNINSIGASNLMKDVDGVWTALSASDIISGKLYRLYNDGSRWQIDISSSSSGDVVGPVSSVSGNLVSFNGTSGKLIQDTGVKADSIIAKGFDAPNFFVDWGGGETYTGSGYWDGDGLSHYATYVSPTGNDHIGNFYLHSGGFNFSVEDTELGGGLTSTVGFDPLSSETFSLLMRGRGNSGKYTTFSFTPLEVVLSSVGGANDNYFKITENGTNFQLGANSVLSTTIKVPRADTTTYLLAQRHSDNAFVRVNRSSISGGAAWGSIPGTLSNQTDLQSALDLKAPLASPTFTGTVTLPSPYTIGANTFTRTGAHNLTLTTTGATTVTLPTTGTLYGTASGSITSSNLSTSVSDDTGSGALVFGISPELTTPTFRNRISYNNATTTKEFSISSKPTPVGFPVVVIEPDSASNINNRIAVDIFPSGPTEPTTDYDGQGTIAWIDIFNKSKTNIVGQPASGLRFGIGATAASIRSATLNGGTVLPLNFAIENTTRFSVNTSGRIQAPFYTALDDQLSGALSNTKFVFVGGGTGIMYQVPADKLKVTDPTTASDANLVTALNNAYSTTPALRSATTNVNVSSAAAPTVGQVLKATSGTAATWQNENAVWGSIPGTLSSQTDLQSALDLKAPLASPTFSGTVGFASRLNITTSGSYPEVSIKSVSPTTAHEAIRIKGHDGVSGGSQGGYIHIEGGDGLFSGQVGGGGFFHGGNGTVGNANGGGAFLYGGAKSGTGLAGNVYLGTSNYGNEGGASGAIRIANAVVNPSGDVGATGGVLFSDDSDGEKLKWRTGTTTYDLTQGASGLTSSGTPANTYLATWTSPANITGTASYRTDQLDEMIARLIITPSTGTTIDFAAAKWFGSYSAPEIGNITDNLTGALFGLQQKIYHNHTSEPTYPAGWVRIGGTYVTSALNIIIAEWIGASRVEYWIYQEQ